MFKKKTTEKAYSGQEVVENIQKKNEEASGLKVLAREFAKDRGALGALILLIILFLGIFIGALFLNTDKVMTVDIFKQYNHPGADGMLLGGDEGGFALAADHHFGQPVNGYPGLLCQVVL